MWRSPRLLLVFWLGLIRGVVTFFVTTIAGDFGDISGPLLFLLSLTTCGCGWSGISSNCGVNRFAPSLSALLLFLFPGLLKGLLDLKALFGRVGLVLGLRDFLISLIFPQIKTHLSELFPFGVLLI